VIDLKGSLQSSALESSAGREPRIRNCILVWLNSCRQPPTAKSKRSGSRIKIQNKIQDSCKPTDDILHKLCYRHFNIFSFSRIHIRRIRMQHKKSNHKQRPQFQQIGQLPKLNLLSLDIFCPNLSKRKSRLRFQHFFQWPVPKLIVRRI
jgi:hypothetical protein